MDSNTRAIAEVLRRWHERESNVTRFPSPSERLLLASRKPPHPTPTQPTPPRAA